MFWFFKRVRSVIALIVNPRRRRKDLSRDPDFAVIRALVEAVNELREYKAADGGAIKVEKPYLRAITRIGRAKFSRDPKDIASAQSQIEEIQDPFWRLKARKKINAILTDHLA